MSGTEGFQCVLNNHITCYVSIYVLCTTEGFKCVLHNHITCYVSIYVLCTINI